MQKMAKLKMKKIEMIALLTDSKKIIELLQRRGVVELCENPDEELMDTSVAAVVSEFEKFRVTAVQKNTLSARRQCSLKRS